jgi:hypothetical protein
MERTNLHARVNFVADAVPGGVRASELFLAVLVHHAAQ